LIVVIVVVVGAVAAGIFLSPPHSTQSSTTTSSSDTALSSSSSSAEGPFKISYDTLTVGYEGGLFQLGLQDLEGKQIVGIVVILSTPYQAVMCSGGNSGAMGFGSCLPAGGKSYTYSPATQGSFPANTTFTGYDSGRGPGSAVAGKTYPLSIAATYVDGTSSNVTLSVQAVSG
jgi:hypothetical protein